MKKSALLILVGAFVSFNANAASWFYPSSGYFQITATQISSGNNYHFRVLNLEPQSICGGRTWAFVNEGDSGAQGKISSLLAAYSAGHYVRLRLKDFVYGSNTYCQIDEIFTSRQP